MNENLATKLEPTAQNDVIEKAEVFNLHWQDTITQKQYPAGVAFYLEKFGEYRLKLDALPEGRPFYLKPSTAYDSTVNYRVEAVIKRVDGKYLRRVEVGTGFADVSTNGFVVMDIGPFCRRLVMDLKARE